MFCHYLVFPTHLSAKLPFNFQNGVIEECDLKEMDISSELERQVILNSVKQLPLKINDTVPNVCSNNNEQNAVKMWLKKINLEQYYDTFEKHLYHDMERVKRIWDVELSAVLDIEKVGHRKRILASVNSGDNVSSGPQMDDKKLDFNTLVSKMKIIYLIG